MILGRCGHVLAEPMFPHVLQKNAWSKIIGWMPSSSRSKLSKIRCAS